MKTILLDEPWDATGGWRARFDPRVLLVIAVLAGVFAGFLAIGRATHTGGGPRTEAPPLPAVIASSATIPVQLSTAPPLDAGSAGTPAAPSVTPAPAAAISPTPSGASSAQSAPVSKPAPAPVVTPVSTPAPAPAAAGRPAHSQPSPGAGTFDTSG